MVTRELIKNCPSRFKFITNRQDLMNGLWYIICCDCKELPQPYSLTRLARVASSFRIISRMIELYKSIPINNCDLNCWVLFASFLESIIFDLMYAIYELRDL
ncbi:hypothetical protein BpHYR1_013744 [Brachionus plicatilis]|uniref:Uncharacterized protein n=1 Tax=Brachionus plicatilis TaxID=10195 RepID=A0A3M7PA79_BRAPC|nr:hypothetical protein BpHYR1_013744 [Brachionus plicatilis]